MADLSFIGITGLALADSVNPCELAVLTMVLITLLIQHPENRKKVLYGGIAFVLAVYIGYLIYGLIIVQFFKTFSEILRQNSTYIYTGLGVLSMILGALNIKDYFYYSPGGLATEMPLSFRPRVKKLIENITSPKGAFIIGILVTILLLPCTMGPLIVASGLLSQLGIFQALLWLLYYNLIFVSPMILVVAIIYYGFRKIEEVSDWKERNIRNLHLIAGILLFSIGFALLTGWLY
ncbi:MAG: GAP family protein [Nanoarchaeota archaeon]